MIPSTAKGHVDLGGEMKHQRWSPILTDQICQISTLSCLKQDGSVSWDAQEGRSKS